MKLKSIGLKTFAVPTNKIEKALDFLKDFTGIMLMCLNFSEASIKGFVLFALGFMLLKSQVKVTMEDE